MNNKQSNSSSDDARHSGARGNEQQAQRNDRSDMGRAQLQQGNAKNDMANETSPGQGSKQTRNVGLDREEGQQGHQRSQSNRPQTQQGSQKLNQQGGDRPTEKEETRNIFGKERQ